MPILMTLSRAASPRVQVNKEYAPPPMHLRYIEMLAHLSRVNIVTPQHRTRGIAPLDAIRDSGA